MRQEKCIYWWHIVNNGESSLIQKCHKTQQNNPEKNWIFISYVYHTVFYFEETPVTGCAVQAGPQQEDANPSRQGFSVVIQKV